jgi:phage baseplate assembly protein W
VTVNFESFLGNGLIIPFERDGKNDFANASGRANIESALQLILGTKGSSGFTQGELPWRPEFGSVIHHLKLQPNNPGLREQAHHFVVEAVQRWDRRIEITNVDYNKNDSTNEFFIVVTYDIVEQNSTDNAVDLTDLTATLVF